MAISHIFPFFVLILTVLRSSGQVFCRTSYSFVLIVFSHSWMGRIGLWEEAWVLSDLLSSFCTKGTQSIIVLECLPVQDPQGHADYKQVGFGVLSTKEGTHLREL